MTEKINKYKAKLNIVKEVTLILNVILKNKNRD